MPKNIQNTFLAGSKCKQMEESVNQKVVITNIIWMTSRERKGSKSQVDLCLTADYIQ